MKLPFISAICLQYGDVPQLEDSLGCFLSQDYQGEHEIVILNSFSRQKLQFEHPRVRIINLLERPPSLADCRNMAVEHALGTHIVIWDSDDAFAPWYLSTIAKHFGDGEWAWMDKQFSIVGWKIKEIVKGSMNSVVFTKEAWSRIGGYHGGLNVGEDRQFVGRLTSAMKGQRITLAPEEIGFLYSWGEGNYHISGEGEDRPGRRVSYDRVRQDMEKRVSNGRARTGEITLVPAAKRDYGEMARRFISQRTEKTQSVAVVLLGRFGDIINALPILKHINDSYTRPALVVSREFAQLLEGVSYVSADIVDLAYDQLLPAIRYAERAYNHVLVGQVHGKGWAQPRLTESYNMESWRQMGFLHRWDDLAGGLDTVFDRRNAAREEALAQKIEVPGKPMILYKLDECRSSPCAECPKLIEPIRERFGKEFNLVNLSDVKAERIFDLLGLMDRARLLITIDTSILHLAAASSVPTVALVNPAPWLGTVPRCSCVLRATYAEAPDRLRQFLDTQNEFLDE